MNLSNLKPPKGMKHAKKRVGRGQDSGNGLLDEVGHRPGPPGGGGDRTPAVEGLN